MAETMAGPEAHPFEGRPYDLAAEYVRDISASELNAWVRHFQTCTEPDDLDRLDACIDELLDRARQLERSRTEVACLRLALDTIEDNRES